jgi:hypothetical protein
MNGRPRDRVDMGSRVLREFEEAERRRARQWARMVARQVRRVQPDWKVSAR